MHVIILFYTFNKELIMMAIKLYHMISLLLAKLILIIIIIIYYNYDENNCDYKFL